MLKLQQFYDILGLMKEKTIRRIALGIGIIAMILLVLGTISESGSLLQKIFFIIGAPVLGLTAYLNRQKMFVALQSVAAIGAVLAFFPAVIPELKYAIMIGISIIALCYLIKTNHYKKDPWGILGSLGLILIAIGFATNPLELPRLFGFLLGVGGIFVAIYSAIGFFYYKIRIAIIWFILNIIFSINPMLLLISK